MSYSCLALTTWSSVWKTYHTTGGIEAVPSKLLEVVRIGGNQFKKIIPLMGGINGGLSSTREFPKRSCTNDMPVLASTNG